jgi:hypothetical protein
MKKKITIIIVLLGLFMTKGLVAQESFTYTVTEDDPGKGNKLYAGIGYTSPPLFGDFETYGAFGPEIQAYNILDRFGFKFASGFQTGIVLLKDKKSSGSLLEKINDKKYSSVEATITTELFSFVRNRSKRVTLKEVGNVNYVSYIKHNRKNLLGLRIGFDMLNAPLPEPAGVKGAYYTDSTSVSIYGYQQSSISLGLTFSNLTNLKIDTDLFGEVQKKDINHFYADILIPINTKGSFCKYVMDSTNNQYYIPMDFSSSQDFLTQGISFRLGWEKLIKFPYANIPLSGKSSIEIIQRQYFDIEKRKAFYIQLKLTVLGIVKP